MVVDTSALVAILRGEDEKDTLIEAISVDPDPVISAADLLEALIVVESRLGVEGAERLERLLEAGGVRVVAFSASQSRAAHQAWRDYGKGNSPARLNLGDCFSYALAKETGSSLLFKGDDFAKTDVPAAI